MRASDNPISIPSVILGLNRFQLYLSPYNVFPTLASRVDVSNVNTPIFQMGFDVSRLWLTLSYQQTQFIQVSIFIGDTDVSQYLASDVQIDWPDESGGSCSFSLRSQNPFNDNSIITIDGDEITVFATLIDPTTGENVTVQIFTGRIVQFDYNPDEDLTEISLQDMSRDVSRDTDRLNQEVLGVDPIVTEKLTCKIANKLTVTQFIQVNLSQPVIGIWAEEDTSRSTNLIDQGDFTILSNKKTISFFTSGIIQLGNNYVVRYQVPTGQFQVPMLTKSAVIRGIADLAGITTVRVEREGHAEDEIIGVNIAANDELPLDLIRKIIVPQTWKVEYNEYGDLVVRREVLKADADFIYDESIILEKTLKIVKDTDSVINEIRIAGIIKRLGNSGKFL